MSNTTIGEIVDVVSDLSIKKISLWVLKWYVLLQVIQFFLAFAFISYMSLVYPEKVVNFARHGTMPWEEVVR